MRSFALLAGAFLLLSVAGLSSSSEADEPLFVRSAQQLERLWSGVLGCTHPEENDARPTFETTLENTGVPSAIDHDYVECGKRALRNASSRMLVNAIEDAVRSGGVALLDENFRLDSNLGLVLGETVTGSLDAVVPLPWIGDERFDGAEQALFLQPGLVFWPGLAGENRIDANLGLVYRTRLKEDVVAGGSAFYDYDLERGSRRFGLGADLQSGVLRAGLNYYIPLNRWREGRADYEEQPLQGGDFRLGLALPSARFDTSVGFWRLEGEDDVRTKWRPSLGFDAGFRISPGVFLEAGYERHNKDESIGSRWNTGLAVRFNLPGLDGVIAPSDSSFSPDLFKPVEREKRILYEEREAVPRIQLVPRRTGSGLQMLVEEGSTVTIAGGLARLPVPVMLQLAIDDASTADLGGDFTYGHKVYEWDADTRQQRAPDTATECPAAMCAMVIPSGVTEFDIDLNILDDSEDKEIPEHIVLRVDVPSEYRRLVRGGETTVTIRAHGNTVEFASSSGTELMENGGTATVKVDVDLPPPAPITLRIETGGTARHGTDYRAPERLTIPAGADSVELTLTGINNEISEGNKTILLTLSNNLPDGWEYTENGNVHAITLLDDDLSIGFTGSGNPTFVDEDDGTVELMVAANQSLPAAATVAWSVDLGGAVTAGDFTGSTGGNLSFQQGDGRNNPRTIILRLNNDTGPEDAEEVTVTLNEAGSSLPDGWSVGGSHTFTIDSNDGAITFADASTPLTINEGETRAVRVVSTAAGPRGGYPLRVSFSPSASGQIDFRESLSLPAGQDAATFNITVNRDDVPEEARTYTMSLGSGSSAPRGWTVSSTRTVTVPFSDGRISFADARITAAEGGSSVETTLVMNPPPASNTTISMSITGGAQEGTDYTRTILASGNNVAYQNGFVYPANAASVTFRVSAMEDTDRVNERAIYRITNFPAGYSAGANTSLQIDLNDNDIGDVQFATGLDGSADEGESVTLRVQASSAATADLNLRWSASPSGEFDSPGSGTVTVRRNSRDATFRVTIDNPDPPDPEAAEDVVITLSGSDLPAGWSLGSRTTHRINIPANDRRVTFSPTEATVLESEESYNLTLSLNDVAPAGGVPLRITVTRGSDSDITLSTSDTDKATWNAGTRTFTIQEGERSAVLQVAFLGDDDFNEDSYTLSFARGAGFPSNEGWEIANSSFQLTVNDPRDDTVQFASDNPTKINEGETITLGVVVSGGNPSSPLNLNWSLEDAGNDISDDSGSVTVSGVRTTFNVPTMGDMISELAESFTVTLSADNLPSGFSLGTRRTHGFTINPSDNTIKFASASRTVGEGDGTYNARVEVNLPNPGRISLNVTTGGSATRGSDYTVDSSVFVPANGSTMDIPVAIIDDSDFAEEDNETIELTIAGSSLPTGWKVVSPMTHTITITDNDSAPGGTFGFAASGNAATASEGDTVSLTVRSTAAPAMGSSISFNWLVSPAGEVATSSGSETITAPATSETFDIEIVNDAVAEIADEITVTLTDGNASDNFTLNSGTATHTITIAAEDNTIDFSSNTGTIAEQNTTSFNITLRINQPLPAGTVASVDLTPSGTAASDDYTRSPASGNNGSISGDTWTLPTGTGTATLEITAVADGVDEADSERVTFTLENLTGATGWSLGSATTQHVDISDADSTPSGTFGFATSGNAATASEGDTVSLTVRSTAAPAAGSPISFNWSVSPSGEVETNSRSGSGTITAPATSETFDIEIVNDAVAETADEITVTLTDGNASDNFTLNSGTATHTITIAAEDNTIDFSSNTGTIAEQNTTSFNITLRINQPLPAGTVASVDLTPSGTAASDDYTRSPASGNNGSISGDTWTLPTGTGTATLEITAVADGVDEADSERVTFTLENLTGATGWSLGSATTQHVDISDADSTPSGTFGFAASGNAATASEGDTVSLTVRSTAAPAMGSSISFNWSVSPSGEVVTSSGSGTITAPATSETFDIAIMNDSVAETADEITVTLTDGNTSDDFTLNNSAATHIITIAAEDNTVAFTSSTGSIVEQNTTSFNITLGINQPLPAGTVASVDLTPSGTAASNDYTRSPASGNNGSISGDTWTLPTGTGTATLEITAVADGVDEADSERVTFTLENLTGATGWSLGSATTQHVDISDADDPPAQGGTFRLASASSPPIRITEGGSRRISAFPLKTIVVGASGFAHCAGRAGCFFVRF